MAYKNLVAQSCNNPIETFLRIRDFLCAQANTYDYTTTGVGWTYHDSSYAVNEDTISINDWFVLASTGEDGQRQLYVKFTYVSGYINIDGYLYWNNSTHVGYKRYYAYSVAWNNTLATNNILWIYADLDKITCVTKYTSTYYWGVYGWSPESAIDQTITTHTGSISAGSAVAVTFDSVPVTWVAGGYVFIYDNANIERLLISSIVGAVVTFATIVASYSVNCKFCLEVNYFQGTSNAFNPLIDQLGGLNTAISPESATFNAVTGLNGLTGKYPIKKSYLSAARTLFGPIKNELLTVSGLANEGIHVYGGVNYRYFNVGSKYVLLKEV